MNIPVPPFPGLHSKNRAEDTAFLLRKCIEDEGAEKKKLLHELELLRSHVSDDTSAIYGERDDERFVLLSSFSRDAPVTGLAVSCEDSVITVAGDGRARIFDFPQWRARGEIVTDFAEIDEKEERPLVDVACPSGDPRICGLAVRSGVQLWDHQDGAQLATMKHDAPVHGLHFHPLQPAVGTVSGDRFAAVWDTATSKQVRNMSCSGSPTKVRFVGSSSPHDFTMVTTCRDGAVEIWDIRKSSRVECLQGESAAVAMDCHAASHLLVFAAEGGEVCSVDLRTYKELSRWSLQEHLGPQASAGSLSISPCGDFLASGCVGGELLLFDLPRSRVISKMVHHSDAVTALAWGGPVTWAAAPAFLAAGSLDGSWSCWAHSGRGVMSFDP